MAYPQPPGFGYDPLGPQPNSYLAWGILSTICCCLPAGIVSIVYASQVGGKYAAGDYPGAVAASANARRWAIISASASAAFAVVWLVIAIVVLADRNAT